jgi:hypothetical protein
LGEKFCFATYLPDHWKFERENGLAKKVPDPAKKGVSGIEKGI